MSVSGSIVALYGIAGRSLVRLAFAYGFIASTYGCNSVARSLLWDVWGSFAMMLTEPSPCAMRSNRTDWSVLSCLNSQWGGNLTKFGSFPCLVILV